VRTSVSTNFFFEPVEDQRGCLPIANPICGSIDQCSTFVDVCFEFADEVSGFKNRVS
jgi:hypothetical protein